MTGFAGTTSHTPFTNPDDLSSPIGLTYDYTRPSFGDWEYRRIVPLLSRARVWNACQRSPRPAGRHSARCSPYSDRHLPYSPARGLSHDLPDPVHVKTDFTTFDKTYRFDGKDIVIERTIVVLSKKLPKTEWKRYQAFGKDIGQESEPWIQLIRPAIASGKPPGEKAADAANLLAVATG